MEITFDPVKDAINRDKHGVSLAFGERIMADPGHIVVPTLRLEDEEPRFKVIGQVGGRSWTGILVYRGSTVRFISVRRSNSSERRIHHSD
jgi:uncharacterized DUF497 family protein